MKRIILIVITLLLAGNISNNILNAQKVSSGDLKKWVSFLASDEMKGRANGSPEMAKAADWIHDMFAEAGLKPVFPENSYFQNYSFTGQRQQVTNEKNVIGMIPGTDPELKNQYILLTAHFDHIGIRKPVAGDSIYNGADDNATGVATLIAIAKAIKESGKNPGRSLVFAAFSGEERGMRGSRFFVANPPVALADIYVDLNFEMTGHSESYGKNNYYMTGCGLSDLDDLIKTYPGRGNVNLIDTIKIAGSLFFASDNIAFSRISVSPEGKTTGIPSGTFATTTMAPYIHSVEDEAEKCDFDNMAELTTYFSRVVLWLSGNKTQVSWTNTSYSRPK
ncbi:MAG: M20/M25/M40 family metallo-hydrolase [Bacteroidales bacterium]